MTTPLVSTPGLQAAAETPEPPEHRNDVGAASCSGRACAGWSSPSA